VNPNRELYHPDQKRGVIWSWGKRFPDVAEHWLPHNVALLAPG